MELGSIHHIAINTADYDRTKEFYVNLLGFEILGEYLFPSGTKRLDCQKGDARLEIFGYTREIDRPVEPHLGYRHLCFKVTDISKTAAELKALGIEVEEIRPDPMAGGLMTFFKDPDGLVLELHE